MDRISTTGDIEVSTYLEIAKERRGQRTIPRQRRRRMRETVAVIDFGSQYNMLIARRVRECNVYSEMVPYDAPWEKVAALNPKGFILSGGPASVYEEGAPMAPSWVYDKHLPVLGICYGMQTLVHQLGGKVTPTPSHEYGHATLNLSTDSPLWFGLPPSMPVWMSHGDLIVEMPPSFSALAYT
ncbi:MAG: GMP synthase (glutamine-hydrolyzing), partial [Dehalococcoidia bacterium]|nr:GMP synthase (glutamine-hydrolyzing) [Dehalococcoidia bacterium]